jgi:hypothetical protein
MNGKLILQLSLFGLAMGIATVFAIPSSIEPVFWIVIFILCAYIFAKTLPSHHFLHGFLLGLANSVWVTGSHLAFFNQYIARHAREAAMMSSMPLPQHPRLMMALTGPVIGIISGVVIGVLAAIAAKILRRAPSAGVSAQDAA